MDHEEQLLIIEVTDNGIGRKAADELNMQNRSEHQSFGNSAIEKRIKLLNFKRKDVVGVEIRDNFKENQSSGTTVIIQIHV
jgi:sensor histidine kinase YesM